MTEIPFLPYAKHVFGGGEIEAVLNVLEKGWIARGPLVPEFENLIAETFGYSSVVACSSGSTALDIVINSLNLPATAEVIVPTLSWPATASCVKLSGAKVVFADIDNRTNCISSESIKSKISSNTAAIIVVHFAGYPCDMEAIWEIAEENNLLVIEDAAHAFGGQYLDGSSVGSSPRSYAATFSFHPAKNMTTAEGGLIVTSDHDRGQQFVIARAGGVERAGDQGIQKAKYRLRSISSNYHLSELHAAIGIAQLEYLAKFIAIRKSVSARYYQQLAELAESGLVLPAQSDHSAFNLFVIRLQASSNEKLIAYLNSNSIGAYYHYPLLHHEYEIFDVEQESLANSEAYMKEAVSLPLGPHITHADVDRVSQCIKSFLAQSMSVK